MAILLVASIIFMAIGCLSLTATTNNRKTNLFTWIAISIFWGTSYIYAPDIPGYIEYYNHDVYNWFESGLRLPDKSFEIGFNVLSSIFKSLNFPYFIFQFFLFSLELLIIYKGIEKLFDISKLSAIFCALFFILPLNLMGALRQGIAIALFIYSLHYITNRDFLKYCAIIIIASLFHNSACFLILIYWLWIPNIRSLLCNRKLLIAYLIVLNVCYFGGISAGEWLDSFLNIIISSGDAIGKYERYIDNASTLESNFGIAKIVELNFTYIIFLVLNKDESTQNTILKLMLILYITLNLLAGGILAHRIGYYFIITYQISLLLSFIILGKLTIRNTIIGYSTCCIYLIIINLFHFNNYFTDNVPYINLLIDYIK